jgi:hypothetical protein
LSANGAGSATTFNAPQLGCTVAYGDIATSVFSRATSSSSHPQVLVYRLNHSFDDELFITRSERRPATFASYSTDNVANSRYHLTRSVHALNSAGNLSRRYASFSYYLISYAIHDKQNILFELSFKTGADEGKKRRSATQTLVENGWLQTRHFL